MVQYRYWRTGPDGRFYVVGIFGLLLNFIIVSVIKSVLDLSLEDRALEVMTILAFVTFPVWGLLIFTQVAKPFHHVFGVKSFRIGMDPSTNVEALAERLRRGLVDRGWDLEEMEEDPRFVKDDHYQVLRAFQVRDTERRLVFVNVRRSWGSHPHVVVRPVPHMEHFTKDPFARDVYDLFVGPVRSRVTPGP